MQKKKKFILHRSILCDDVVRAALVCTHVHVLTVRRHTATIQDMSELGGQQSSTIERTTTTTTHYKQRQQLACVRVFVCLCVLFFLFACVRRCACGREMDVVDTVRLRYVACWFGLTVCLTCWYRSVIFPYDLGWYHDNGEGGGSSSGSARVSSCQSTCLPCTRTR